MAALGNLALKVTGIMGGLLAIIIGLIWLIFGFIASASYHVGSAGALTEAGAVVFMLFGLLAIYSIVAYDKKPMFSSKLLLSSGILGFLAGYVADYPIMQGIMGLLSWTVPGALMTIAGLIGWITPKRLAATLPLLNNERGDVRLAAKVLYGGLFVGIIVMMIGVLLFCSVMFIGLQEESKSDEALISDARTYESYGQYDSALSVYERIIARNESNAKAWWGKSYALAKLGRHDEANESYHRALQLETPSSEASSSLKETRGLSA